MDRIEEAVVLLTELGMPRAQQNERSALTLLALTDLKGGSPWSKARERNIRIHDILAFIEKNYNKKYAENTRETIRRQTLHQFEQAGIVVRNKDDPNRPTNSPNTVYAISSDALNVAKKYESGGWKRALKGFLKKKGKLIDRYSKRTSKYYQSLRLPGGISLHFSPGKHNELQIDIINLFRGFFCPKAKLVYVGDAARKMLHLDKELMSALKIPITRHDKLPDVVLYDEKLRNLFLIEAVTAHGPVSPKRQIELEKTLKKSKARRVYVSAFPDFKEFKKHLGDVAWDTEVWLRENPEHMIHFNGDKFFSVYGGKQRK